MEGVETSRGWIVGVVGCQVQPMEMLPGVAERSSMMTRRSVPLRIHGRSRSEYVMSGMDGDRATERVLPLSAEV